jgi:hypothetical protein
MRLRLLLGLVAATALIPSTAAADFHFVSIREVFPGDSTNPDAEYVELQAWTSGQEFVEGHTLTFRGPTGAVVGSPEAFDVDVKNGQNQMTFVMATATANARFGMIADDTMSTVDRMNPTGGAVCWEIYDCVSWGNFSGASLPSNAGSPVLSGGIPDGQAIRRTIAPGCATLLELSDDRNNSALDFAAVFPSPRPNSVPPSERACGTGGGGGGGGGGQGGKGGPNTILKSKPAKRTTDRTPTFRFRSNEGGATFQCKLDGKPYRGCKSPYTSKKLSLGPHIFRVRAKHRGDVDGSPAVYRFRVIPKKRG